MKTATTKTVTNAQMKWMLANGYAWIMDDDGGIWNDDGVIWTREGGYTLGHTGLWEMTE